MTYFQLRDYGVDGQIGLERTPQAFLDALYAVFDEVKRVLRDDGVVFVNLGDSYAGSGKGPTGESGIGDQERRQGFTGVSSKSTLNHGAGASVHQKTGKMLLGGGTAVQGIRPKSLMLIPERFAIGMADRGWIVRSQIVWAKKSAMPESVRDRPTSAWEPIWMFTKQPRYFWDQAAVAEPQAEATAARRDRADLRAKDGRADAFFGDPPRGLHVTQATGTANLRNVWHLGPEPQGSFTWSERVPVSVDDADDDTERTTSPDCPIHAGRRASTSRRGGLPGDPRSRSQRTDSRPVPGRQGADVPTADLFSAASETACSSDGLAASPHSTPSSRTDPHAATSVPDTASGGTPLRTGDIREIRGSSVLHPDTHESSTASDGLSASHEAQTPSDIADIGLSVGQTASVGLHDAAHIGASSTSAGSASRAHGPSVRTTASSTDKSTCTCSYSKVIIQESAHFAAYPTEIPRRCILAATSEKGQCPACGAPWRRVVERERNGAPWINPKGSVTQYGGKGTERLGPGIADASRTLGWEAGCTCDAGDPVPQVVLDPFLGSGTTALVADRLERNAIGIELSPQYAAMARRRIEGDAPLFADVEVAS